MNKIEEYEGSLQKLLSVLKKNRDAVDKQLLNTIYKQAYDDLLRQINQAATAYVHEVTLRGLVLNPDIPFDTQVNVLNQTIEQSGIMLEMGKVLSETYDVEKLHQLALQLREKLELALWPYINLQTCLVADLFDLEKEPVIYNTLTQQIYVNGVWVDHPIDLQGNLLVYAKQDTDNIGI
ncbi:hypothetical protein NE647_09875 [Blautia coccoides]|uniref:Uncharacterized protein n=1 Tax=Blautia hominis TaxID=2025493 RepID=A0ABQ0B3I2_9FIRM|nr:hypothetical protein [Blautia coccoides]MCQ4640740.1 hypothetical protein [Blautia coccoides]